MKPFDIDLARQGHPVCYRDGAEPDEIHICPDWVSGRISWPVMTLFGDSMYTHKATGRYLVDDATDSSHDLFLKTEKKTGWMNLYTEPASLVYWTEAEARAARKPLRRAITVKLEWDE